MVQTRQQYLAIANVIPKWISVLREWEVKLI
jgi:hypothetical protein